MKQSFIIIGMTLAVLLTACTSLNDIEQHIVGTWYSSWVNEEVFDDTEIEGYPWLYRIETMETSTDEYLSNKTEVEQGTLKYKYTLDFSNSNRYYYIVLEYHFRYEGEWSVNNNCLMLKGSKYDIELADAHFMGTTGDTDEDYYIEQLKHMNTLVFESEEMFKQRKQDILYLSDTELKTIEEEGDTLTLVRID